ncbi:MAG TPA: hypothetical protein VLF21_03065 [Candidatus Saccharimonadales bacterium]|nr:hypothetical protein [Candidatus Saccharimonadales bacterium]
MADEGKAKTDQIIEDYYDRHPEEAEKVGADLIDEQRKEDQQEAAINAVAAGNSYAPNNNYFRSRFLWLTNLSWTQWFLLSAALGAISFFLVDVLSLPPIIDKIIEFGFVIYLIATRAGRL